MNSELNVKIGIMQRIKNALSYMNQRRRQLKLENKVFALLETVIALGVMLIIATIVITILKPQEIIAKSRDFQRINNLNTYQTNIKLALLEADTNYTKPRTIYLSLQDTTITCASYIDNLPELPPDWSYNCSNNPENADGTGWLPIDFRSSGAIQIDKLKIDPVNKPPYYYTYIGGSFELTAYLEYEGNRGNGSVSAIDSGKNPYLLEAGTNTLTPYQFEIQRTTESEPPSLLLTTGEFYVKDALYNNSGTNSSPVHDSSTTTGVLLADNSQEDFFIEHNLGRQYVVSKFKVDAVVTAGSLQIDYYDGINWIQAGTISSSGWQEFSTYTTIDRWRVRIDSASGSLIQVNEMEVYE